VGGEEKRTQVGDCKAVGLPSKQEIHAGAGKSSNLASSYRIDGERISPDQLSMIILDGEENSGTCFADIKSRFSVRAGPK